MGAAPPIRLDAELLRVAKAAAKVFKRSVPRQIEYWAELGRVVETMLDREELVAVQEGLARIVVQDLAGGEVAADDVFAELEAQRQQGRLPDRVSEATVRYQRSRNTAGLIEQVRADGTRREGRFVNGKFRAAAKK